MVNAKAQLDFLLRLNKIVIFQHDNSSSSSMQHTSRKKTVTSSTPINTTSSTCIDDYLKNKGKSERALFETTDLKGKKLTQSSSGSNQRIETNVLLELYGVASKYVTVIYMNKLNNANDCEAYIRKTFCPNQQEFAYPIIFINGIFFGSELEINYAHGEGILFELLSNVGLFEETYDLNGNKVDKKMSEMVTKVNLKPFFDMI
jgi:hypothetical protein